MRDAAGFLKNYTLKALNIPFKKVVLPRRVKCGGGMEGEVVVDHGCRKRKKLICGPEGEKGVAHGRLPSLALCTYILLYCDNLFCTTARYLKIFANRNYFSVLIFTSDNGGGQGDSSNKPLKGKCRFS